ncbi:MAG: hypothetical protein PHQ23_04460 [Candidatus Wallbacteria bacterium]|nr:hypothetical protein [Candidatus Wallbacteria bacterium]
MKKWVAYIVWLGGCAASFGLIRFALAAAYPRLAEIAYFLAIGLSLYSLFLIHERNR